MNRGTTELYQPRTVSHMGQWEIGDLELKVYGLLADGTAIDEPTVLLAQSVVRRDMLLRVRDEGDSNGMGFVIIHPGTLGLTIAAHWWTQGSVLCQHVYRKLYSAAEPMDTARRPAVGCVWELALINAEQEAWRKTMMKDKPDPSAYMEERAAFETA